MTPLPPLRVGDADRLAALDGFGILDTPEEAGFDDVVHLACRLCAAPVALVSLVAGDRQWFKARLGFPPCQTDLNSSVCAHALATPERLLVIPDLREDPRTAANPLVTGDPFLRFYAGAPLVTPEGQVLGTLCVIDHKPRPNGLTDRQADDLRALARQVMAQLELRRAIAHRDAVREEERQAFRAREALRDAQAAVVAADGDLDSVLAAVVRGALHTVPAADGGAVELVDGADLEYRAAAGTLAPHVGLRVPLAGSLAGHCATSRVPQRMADAALDPHIRRDLAERLGLRSAIVTPVLRGDVVLGALKLQSAEPDAFTERDLELLGLLAGVATAGLATAEAGALIRAKDVYWRGLFDRLSEGFLVAEVVRDRTGAIADWRYLEINPAWGALVGVDPATVVGRTIREVFPGVEDAWVDEFADVVRTGEPAAFTRQVGTLRRWYEGRAFALGGDRFGVLFLEVTARVEAERRRDALLGLGDHLRDAADRDEIATAAATAVGEALGLSRAGYCSVDADRETIAVEQDWRLPGLPSIAGEHRFRDYGSYIEQLKRGETVIVHDVRTDPRTAADADSLAAVQCRALFNLPVMERGRFVGLLFALCGEPRAWTDEEARFLREVADRTRAAVARAEAEEQQRLLNGELAHRLKNTLAIVQSIATQTLRGVTERDIVQAFDRRVLALSRAHDALVQRSWSSAGMRAVMEGVLTLQADIGRFRFDGPDMDVSADAAMSLSLLMHELATNALKYGALSAASGTVRVAWRTEEAAEPMLALKWAESGGPPTQPPSGRTGFGSKLIRMGLLGTRDADIRYEVSGLQAAFKAPLAQVRA
ncbi:GAF domain-containing protein [Lichenibacterium dinghuense]|uniref:GAF domain-containing protein n=1 Tax=Lichenibacterium dinghuense TaxID=2895977 RepID=UPI001EFF85B2|nr:GAF domain-containing protein [Lichenibacterium sp. 6Y81]